MVRDTCLDCAAKRSAEENEAAEYARGMEEFRRQMSRDERRFLAVVVATVFLLLAAVHSDGVNADRKRAEKAAANRAKDAVTAPEMRPTVTP